MPPDPRGATRPSRIVLQPALREDAWPSRAGQIVAFALIGVTMALYAVAYAYVTLIPDGARDLAAAWHIAQGDAWPWRGPTIGMRWQLGPAWYIALSPVLAAAPSIAAAMVIAGVLAALKFVFAYRLGVLVQGRALGLLWVALLAVPGWNTFEQVVFAHTNVVAATTLGTLLAAWWLAQQASPLRAATTGFVFALALHAHPTTIVLAPVLAVAWWRGTDALGPRVRLAMLGWSALGFFVPLLPVLIDEIRHGFAQVAATGEFVGETSWSQRLERVWPALRGYAWHPVPLLRDYLLAPLPGRGVIAWLSAVLLALGWVLALALPDARLPWRYRLLAVLYVTAALAAIVLLRPGTSFYQVYVIVPLAAAVAAAGWSAAVQRFAAQRAVTIALGAVLVCGAGFGTAVLLARQQAWRDGWQAMSESTNGDIAATPRPASPPFDYYPVVAIDELSRALCARTGAVAVGGDAGTMLEYSQGLGMRLTCSTSQRIAIAGDAAGIAGYPIALLRQANVPLPRDAHGYVWVDVPAWTGEATPRAGAPLALREQYPPHAYRSVADSAFATTRPLRAGDWLAISNTNRAFIAMDEPRVVAGETVLVPVARSGSTWVYRITEDADWRIEAKTGDAAWLSIVTLKAGAVRAVP